MSKLVTEPGVYDIPAADYHADPAPLPSLSSSLAKVMIGQTPRHAWERSSRLNPDYQDDNKAAFDLGHACHDLLLEGDTGLIVRVEANDWRTKVAKEAREAAYAAGKTPLLPKQHDETLAMRQAALDFLATTELAGLLDDGQPERSLFGQWNGTWLRARPDWLRTDRKLILDYKTTAQSASPESFGRTTLFNLGYDIGAALYTLVNGLTGGPEDAAYIWLVQETCKPYACSLVGASPAILEIGEHKVMHAITQWQACLDSGTWPAYGPRIAYPEPPPWQIAAAEALNYTED